MAVLLIILLCTLFAGCSSNEKPADNNQPPEQNEPAPIDNNDSDELITDTGTFTGRIDDQSIEIHISGVPEDIGYRAFELSEELRQDFDSFGFETGEQVIFKYQAGSEGRRGVIKEIKLIEN
ncbi:hypothetical protein ASZ90_019072 [hydrocarbon metagenome]|uniref:Uncharacterized protein n=1 Tax=hydrocarbon metagenome TaxID=938273 RepID=A0A0W8E534_9ZZZZ